MKYLQYSVPFLIAAVVVVALTACTGTIKPVECPEGFVPYSTHGLTACAKAN